MEGRSREEVPHTAAEAAVGADIAVAAAVGIVVAAAVVDDIVVEPAAEEAVADVGVLQVAERARVAQKAALVEEEVPAAAEPLEAREPELSGDAELARDTDHWVSPEAENEAYLGLSCEAALIAPYVPDIQGAPVAVELLLS